MSTSPSPFPSSSRSLWLDILTVAVPLGLYVVLTVPLFEWLIDDAGISFVYSRNLAEGYGLVSQPGVEPVEGYSNFLWVILMAPLFWLGIFDPFITSKSISLVFVASSFWLLHKSMMNISNGCRYLSFLILLFLSFNTSFVCWTCSGLENPLLTFLVILLLYVQSRHLADGQVAVGRSILVGLVAVAIALTRPDGIIYAVAFPMVLLISVWRTERERYLGAAKGFAAYCATYGLIYGGFLLFRWSYFGVLYPNTYYAKGGPDLATVIDTVTLTKSYSVKLRGLLASVFGPHLWLIIPIALIVWTVIILFRREQWRQDASLLVMTVLSVLAYMLLRLDWMGEYRFATVFFPLVLASLCVLAYRLISGWKTSRLLRGALAVLVVLVVAVGAISSHYSRLDFRFKHPRVSFTKVARKYGTTVNAWARFLDLNNASYLVPDVGGTLYYSELRVYDLSGLCDRTIARTIRDDLQAFYDYVFEEIKPTFIHHHGNLTAATKFDEDPRFHRDYTAIKEHESKWAERKIKRKIMSGDYVRRDAVIGKEDKLAALRAGKIN